jgi:hypothetical protein
MKEIKENTWRLYGYDDCILFEGTYPECKEYIKENCPTAYRTGVVTLKLVETILESNYIISPISTYDDDLEMFSTKIGQKGKDMLLLYSTWGKTEQESRIRAELLIDNLLNFKL